MLFHLTFFMPSQGTPAHMMSVPFRELNLTRLGSTQEVDDVYGAVSPFQIRKVFIESRLRSFW
jgi:hypothetical protein